MTKNTDFCKTWCTNKEFEIPDRNNITKENLVLGTESNRTLYFSIVGNNPKSPSIALVGLCPGATQLNRFIESYKDGMNIPQAASQSGFRKLGKNLSMLLNA